MELGAGLLSESLFAALSPFFKSMGKRTGEEPTEKEQLRDFKAIQRRSKDGVILLENKKPKLTGPMVEAKKDISGEAA